MSIFVTGANGFIGSAIVKELQAAGHNVVGLARSSESAAELTSAGVGVVHGSLDNLDALQEAAAASEGVIHTAHNHDFANVSRDVAAAQDLVAIKAMGQALSGTGQPFIITSATAAPTEDDDGDPAYPRYHSEQAALAMGAQGVRAMVVRLPPTAHGLDDKSGFVRQLLTLARRKGISAWIGDGRNHWPSVHRLDAARLFRLALEKGQPGSRYHAVDEAGVPTKDIAEAIGRRLNLPIASLRAAEAEDHFGFLGHILALDIHASSAQTRQRLDWQPTHPGLLRDIENGAYGEE